MVVKNIGDNLVIPCKGTKNKSIIKSKLWKNAKFVNKRCEISKNAYVQKLEKQICKNLKSCLFLIKNVRFHRWFHK